MGTLYLGTNRPAKAVPHLRIAAAAQDEPWVVANLANALARSGELDEARAEHEAGVDRAADNAELRATLAAVLFRQGDLAGARDHYRAALRINPNFALAAQELAAIERAPTTSTAPATQLGR